MSGGPQPDERPTAREAGVAFALAFGVLAAGACGAHFWLDSGELGAAGYELGVMHPPGTPGLVLLLRAAACVPLGSLGFRMALVGCALGAAAVTLVGLVLARHGASLALRWGTAAWVLTGLTFVRQCRVVEVYPLAAALLMVTVWGFDPKIAREHRTGPRLIGTFAAVWATWCFGDLRLALVPLVLVAWWMDVRRGRPWARWAPPVVVMACAVLAVLPLASVTGPWMDWGNPQTIDRLWAHLQADSIRGAFANEILPASAALWQVNAMDAVARLAEDLGGPGLVVAAMALVLQVWTRPWARRAPTRADRQIAVGLGWLVAVQVLYVVGINPMGGADRQTGMVLAPLAALAVGRVAAGWLAPRPRLAWGILPLAGTLALGPALLVSVPDGPVTRSWGPHAWTRGALAQLPPGALLLTQSDDLAAGVAYATLVEGARPDLVVAPAQHLHKEAPEATGRRRAPWLAARTARSERARVEAAIVDHAGTAALEHPATTIMARVRFWSDLGAVPLAIAGSDEVPRRPSVSDEIAHWLPRLPSSLDRRRLAIALSQRARGLARVEGDGAGAVAMLEASVRYVSDEHASTWVTLAALRDRMGDRAGAVALTRRALALEPTRSVALTNLALYLARSPATHAEALTLAARAVQLRPWRKDVWERLAQVRALMGDDPGAAEARDRAAASNAEHR